MGLKKLLTNLSSGDQEGVNPLARSGFTSPTFRQKSFNIFDGLDRNDRGPFIKPVSWDLNDPLAEPTYNDGITRRNQFLINNLDGTVRGGAILNFNRLAIDSNRFLAYFDTDRGAQFISRQVSLQKMNPKINAPYEKNVFKSNPANQRTYNPANTLAQIALGGFGATHIKREGTITGNERGYASKATEVFGVTLQKSNLDEIRSNDSEKNRLLYLYDTKLTKFDYTKTDQLRSLRTSEDAGSWISNALENVSNVVQTIGDSFNNVLNTLGGKGEELYTYRGGPGSIMGIGRTFIGRYSNTVESIGGQIKVYRSHYESENSPSNSAFSKSYFEHTQKLNIHHIHGIPTKSPLRRTFGENPIDPIKNQRIFAYQTGGEYGGSYNWTTYMGKSIDKVNNLDVVRLKDDTPFNFSNITDPNKIKDFIPFYFEAINFPKDSSQNLKSDYIFFRAFLNDVSDDFKAGYNSYKYNGRAENFYTYKDFNRSLSFSFKVAAFSRHEMQPLYRKLNYLVSNTAPEYDKASGRIKTPFMRITIGDWISRLPGLLTNVNLKWSKDYPWEIKAQSNLKPQNNDSGQFEHMDHDMLYLPHVLDVSISYQPIHNFTPQKGMEFPFILPERTSPLFGGADNLGDSITDPRQQWLSYSIWGSETDDALNAMKSRKAVSDLRPIITDEDKDQANIQKAMRNYVPNAIPPDQEDEAEVYGQGNLSFGKKSWKGEYFDGTFVEKAPAQEEEN